MKRLIVIFFLIGFTAAGCSVLDSGFSGWITLIDGEQGLENWNRVGTANWRAVDGAIQADGSEQGPGFLVSKKTYQDFVIRAEFWVSDDANSGIYMRCADPVTIADKSCYEANIFDQPPDPAFGTGALVHIAKVSPMPKAGGKWNTYEITANSLRLTVVLNGVRTVDVENAWFSSGPIALQWAKGVVKFRKVQIRPLGPERRTLF